MCHTTSQQSFSEKSDISEHRLQNFYSKRNHSMDSLSMNLFSSNKQVKKLPSMRSLPITQMWSDTVKIVHHFYFSVSSQQNIYTCRPSKVNKNMLHATLICFVLLSIHLSLRSFSAAACISRTLFNSTEWRCSTTFKVFVWCSSDFFSSKTRLSHFSLRLFLSAINWIKWRIQISFSIS